VGAQHQYNEIAFALSAIVEPGSVFEIRCLTDRKGRADAGYFDSIPAAATALAALEFPYKGVYVTPNPVSPDLLARSYNRITPWIAETTLDDLVLRRRWLLADVDPRRPTGISSTDAEHMAALNKLDALSFVLAFEYGFPMPMTNSSGNGAHGMYPCDLPNTPEVRNSVQTFIKCLAARFNDTTAEIDTSVFNAARIWRLPGTWARKGDNIPTRPHRKSYIIRPAVPDGARVTLQQIETFNAANSHLLAVGVGGTRSSVGGGTSVNGNEYPADERLYKMLNDHAMRRLADWVPHFFPAARQYKEGFRVGSDDLGRDLEEDLTIHPWPLGIKDFGLADQGDKTEGRRTPVSLIAQYHTGGDKAAAARQLGEVLKAPVIEFSPLPAPTPDSLLPGVGPPPKVFQFSTSVRSISDLKRQTFKDRTFIIDNVLPTGNIMLGARPKMRKTWLAMQIGRSVAAGLKFLEWQCNQHEVLGLFLEDNERRIHERFNTLDTFEMNPPNLDGFRYWCGGMGHNSQGRLVVTDPEQHARTNQAFPRGQAGIDALDAYVDEFPKTKLIIIDTFAHFRDDSSERDIYARDYKAQMPITEFANRRNVLVLSVTHEKKGLAGLDSGDFMEDITGSAGVTGGCDGVMSIKGRRGVQDENESRKLMLSGRDVPHDFEVDMTFDAQRGGWLPAARTDVKVAVVTLLQRHPFVNQRELGALLPNIPQARLTKCLTELKFDNKIIQGKFGYSLPHNAQ
jgi:hypothetical protein